MDRDAFFASLSDQAAKPDKKFLVSLRTKVISIASGIPPSTGPTLPSAPLIIITAVVTSIIAGGVTIAVLNNNSDTIKVPNNTIVLKTDSPDDKKVLAVTDDKPKVKADKSKEPTNQTDNLNNSSNGSSNSNNGVTTQTPKTTNSQPTVQFNQDYSISFWNVPPFKLSPAIPATQPDHAVDNVATINFDWGTGKPHPLITNNHFVARATATKALQRGTYSLNIHADDGIRVLVNDRLVYDRWSSNITGTEDQISFVVNAGDDTTKITIEYYENQNTAILKAELLKT
jgi:hypothetical protein